MSGKGTQAVFATVQFHSTIPAKSCSGRRPFTLSFEGWRALSTAAAKSSLEGTIAQRFHSVSDVPPGLTKQFLKLCSAAPSPHSRHPEHRRAEAAGFRSNPADTERAKSQLALLELLCETKSKGRRQRSTDQHRKNCKTHLY